MSSLNLVVAQSAPLIPAGFQERIIDNMSAALLRQPSPPCLLRAPTGSGKTFMLAGVLGKVSASRPTLWLWFVPFVNLLQQTESALLANARGLTPVMLARGRNQEPVGGSVLLSTAQAVARAKDRKAGYAGDGDDDRATLDEYVALARARGLKIGLVVDEAHIGLDRGTEFGQFAHWLTPDYLVMASATPKDARLDEFLAKAGKGAREAFTVSRAEAVEARLNKRYVEAVVYDLRHGVSTIADLKRTVLRQAWLQHLWLKTCLGRAGIGLVPLLLVQVGNGEHAVEEARRDLMRLCKVPPAAIGVHSADEPDPVLMAAIANDQSKEVLIFKQSAGTGFDAPRAFVLASTKPVNDADFAMQFIGRVMRVAQPLRSAFPKSVLIPPELDTAYIYLADADAQQGFQSAVNKAGAVQSQLEGQTERMVERETPSGGKVYTNRTTPQMPVTYDAPPSTGAELAGNQIQDDATLQSQPDLFGPAASTVDDTGSVVMRWDRPAPTTASFTMSLPADEHALDRLLEQQGLKTYRRSLHLRSVPAVLQRETRPILAEMAEVSRRAASRLEMDEALTVSAVRAACNSLREKEVHTELTGDRRREQEVEIVTDRAALLREAEACLRRIPQVEDEDVRIIIGTLAQRLLPQVADTTEGAAVDADEKQLLRLARDAACWVIRKQAQTLNEALLDAVAHFATVSDAQPLPDAMLYPLAHALSASTKNLYGVMPPFKDDVVAECEELSIDAQATLAASEQWHVGGRLTTAAFDGASAINGEECVFIKALDHDDAVIWWHRNPDRKPWSVRLVRSEHTHYFYPDFVVCLAYPRGASAMTRLIETKESTKDAGRKARRVPKVYGKVMFVTKDNEQLRIVNDDGSLGASFDWGDLVPAWAWLEASKTG